MKLKSLLIGFSVFFISFTSSQEGWTRGPYPDCTEKVRRGETCFKGCLRDISDPEKEERRCQMICHPQQPLLAGPGIGLCPNQDRACLCVQLHEF